MAEKKDNGDPLATIARELRKLLIGLPVWFVQQLLVRQIGPFADRPLTVAALLLPLAVAVVWLARPLYRERRLALEGGFLRFLLAFCLLFSIAAGTELLNGPRHRLTGFEDAAPPNFLGLSRLGDWHYELAPPGESARQLLIVTHPSFAGEDPAVPRRLHADLLRRAIEQGARGVAFDFVFRGESRADGVLCFWIQRAEEAGIPVLVGYEIEADESRDLLKRVPLPGALGECIPDQRLGNLAGYREWDNRIRMVPLFLGGLRERPALSYRVAELLAAPAELTPPPDGLLQFTRPGREPEIVEGVPSGADEGLLDGRFVFVGSSRAGDRHPTPFGRLPGVAIHAWAAHSLATGHFVSRLNRLWSFPAIFFACYVLTALQASGHGRRAVLLGAAILSLAVGVAAALAMRLELLWLDVSYPLLAIWVLAGLLLGGTVLRRRRRRAAAQPAGDGG